jgi:hypothetical protein
MSSSSPKWLQKVWDEQAEEAFFYFCAWGYMWMDHRKAPTLPQILDCPQEWDEVIKFVEGQPYSFQDTYGRLKVVGKLFQMRNTLFSTEFPTIYRELRDEEDRNRVLFISAWICLLFLTYFLFTPRMLKRSVVQKCLLLSRNAQYIYRDFWEFVAGWSSNKRTLKANLAKKRDHAEVFKRTSELLEARGSATNFTKLTRNAQAVYLQQSLAKEGIHRHKRTVNRVLKELASSQKLTLRQALTYVRVSTK